METFNKNWLIILLVAMVFGTLGFEDSNGLVKVDTIMKNGKQIIIKEVKKVEKN